MSSKTGVAKVASPFGSHKQQHRKPNKKGDGIGDILEMAKPFLKKGVTLGASAICSALANKAMGNGITPSGNGNKRKRGRGITRSGDGKKKTLTSKKSMRLMRGGCEDCTLKLKNHLLGLPKKLKL